MQDDKFDPSCSTSCSTDGSICKTTLIFYLCIITVPAWTPPNFFVGGGGAHKKPPIRRKKHKGPTAILLLPLPAGAHVYQQ